MTGSQARLSNVTVAFPRRSRPVLDSVTWDVPTGSQTLVLGASGSGKSTLLNLLTGLIPTSVTAAVTGRIERPPTHSIGFLGQDPSAAVCLPLVEQELALVLEGAALPPAQMGSRIADALFKVNGQHLAGRRTATLSGGELQRVGLAAACLNDPELLVLDEPTSMLDAAGVSALRTAIGRRSQAPLTTVVVEHHLDELAGPAGLTGLPQRAIALAWDGTVIDSGPTKDVFARAGTALHRAGSWVPLEVELLAVGGSPGGLGAEANQALLRSRASHLRPPPLGRPLLQARELTVVRGDPRAAADPLLSGVNLTLHAGELVALIGPNGVGKTSLLLSLARLLPTGGGRLDGDAPAMAFQNPEHQFVAGTVRDEVGFKVADPALVTRVLREFRLTEVADQSPFRLSGGEKRLLSLAANVIHDRPVLLADEPTFGLDRRDALATMRSLRSWADADRAVLFASHDLRCAATWADRIIVLGRAGIIADGPTWQVFGWLRERGRSGVDLPALLDFLLRGNVSPQGAQGVLRWLDDTPTRETGWT
ncbi:MAG: ABC transporter ATP-binding protein [Micropruina sp.]|nr:ABC transporter ATP-binding protein [Micropruina sp.]